MIYAVIETLSGRAVYATTDKTLAILYVETIAEDYLKIETFDPFRWEAELRSGKRFYCVEVAIDEPTATRGTVITYTVQDGYFPDDESVVFHNRGMQLWLWAVTDEEAESRAKLTYEYIQEYALWWQPDIKPRGLL